MLGILIIIFSAKAVSQQMIAVHAKDFTTDHLQNVYAITPENEVIKFQPDGREAFRFQNKTLGDSVILDATNPFELLLFYPEYQTVLTLDRTLSLGAQFNLLQLGFPKISAVGMASDGKLWLYDEANFRLKKIAADGSIAAQSADLSLALGRAIQPNFLLEREQVVFLNDPAQGILQFDIFGNYLKTLDIKGLRRFQVAGEQLLFFENGQWQAFHLQALLQRPLKLPEGTPPVENMRLEKDWVFVLQPGGIGVAQFRR